MGLESSGAVEEAVNVVIVGPKITPLKHSRSRLASAVVKLVFWPQNYTCITGELWCTDGFVIFSQSLWSTFAR